MGIWATSREVRRRPSKYRSKFQDIKTEELFSAYCESMSAAMVVAALIASLTFPAVTSSPPNASKGFIWSAALAFSTSVCSLLIFLSLQGMLTALIDWWTFGFLIFAELLLHASVMACYFSLIFSLLESQSSRSMSPTSGAALRATLSVLLAVAGAVSIFLLAKVLRAAFARREEVKDPPGELQYATSRGGQQKEESLALGEGSGGLRGLGEGDDGPVGPGRMRDTL
eukprot:jgi/Botrbrau1/9798/Bobra.0322s0006.1